MKTQYKLVSLGVLVIASPVVLATSCSSSVSIFDSKIKLNITKKPITEVITYAESFFFPSTAIGTIRDEMIPTLHKVFNIDATVTNEIMKENIKVRINKEIDPMAETEKCTISLFTEGNYIIVDRPEIESDFFNVPITEGGIELNIVKKENIEIVPSIKELSFISTTPTAITSATYLIIKNLFDVFEDGLTNSQTIQNNLLVKLNKVIATDTKTEDVQMILIVKEGYKINGATELSSNPFTTKVIPVELPILNYQQ